MNKVGQIISFSIVCLINFVFAFKYFSRGIEHALLLSIFYSTTLLVVFILSKKLTFRLYEVDRFYYFVLILYVIIHVILFHFIHVGNLNVDRWSVISSFWEYLFNDQYPYNAQSHMGNYPGPLPFYFVMALPFYLIGEIGFFSLLGIVIFAIFLRKTLSKQESMGAILIVFLSASVFWEISVRSTILVNTILFMVYQFWIQTADFNSRKIYWTTAIAGGLLLSTRTILALPLLTFCIYLLKSKELTLKLFMGWISIIGGTVLVSFLPLLFFYFHDFLIRNPFTIQGSILPMNISVVFLPLPLIAGLVCRNKNEILYFSAGIFILIFMTYIIYVARRYGLVSAYFNSNIDISYMLFAYPFVLYLSFKNSSIEKTQNEIKKQSEKRLPLE
jgi:hypothetical protein